MKGGKWSSEKEVKVDRGGEAEEGKEFKRGGEGVLKSSSVSRAAKRISTKSIVSERENV